MPNKKERQKWLAKIWATPTPFDVDFFDKGSEIVVTTNYRGDVTGWWIDIFKALYPEHTYRTKADIIKLKPSPGVSVKINKRTGIMKVSGKNHWPWMLDNFAEVLDQGNADMQTLEEAQSISDNSVTRYLQLDKNVEEVRQHLILILSSEKLKTCPG